MIEGDARDAGTLTCSLVVKRAESPRLMNCRAVCTRFDMSFHPTAKLSRHVVVDII
jgi:hypothetical protein